MTAACLITIGYAPSSGVWRTDTPLSAAWRGFILLMRKGDDAVTKKKSSILICKVTLFVTSHTA